MLLNKYPVQESHLLLITQQWQPQAGWLAPEDWLAVQMVNRDTGGLWFFNSNGAAGASQPHRHLQLLPRRHNQLSCPLAPLLTAQLRQPRDPWPWSYCLSAREDADGGDLPDLYRRHALALGLGCSRSEDAPKHPYNILFDDDWYLTVRRVCEHSAGLSINALGFAGYLLCDSTSDIRWLATHGPWSLLKTVAAIRA